VLKLIVDIVCVLIEIGLLRYVYKAFFPQCRLEKKKELFLYLILTIVAFGVSHLEITTTQRMLCSLCIDIIPAIIYVEKRIVKIFVGALFFAVQISCELFSWAFLAFITGNIAENLDGHSLNNYIQGVFLSKSLAIAILYVISGFGKYNEYHGKQLLLCIYMIFPVIATLCLNQVAYATNLLQNEASHARFLLVAFFMMVINIALFYLFDKQMQAEKIRWEYQMVSLREHMQGEYYKSLIKRDLEVSKQYHDMKNHISFLKYQANEGNLVAIQEYLKALSDQIVMDKVNFTNQNTVNAILNIKTEQAKEKHIVLDIMVSKVFPLVRIADIDLVIVLANCLDNAIEAVEKIKKRSCEK